MCTFQPFINAENTILARIFGDYDRGIRPVTNALRGKLKSADIKTEQKIAREAFSISTSEKILSRNLCTLSGKNRQERT